MNSTFHVGDAGAFDLLAGARSLDCIVQDPPAGIAFMGAQFDRDHGGRDAWIKLHAGLFAAGRRACKPGAWSLTWALPRTSHWTACALDDAGWEITDCITHLNGQGWPKNARTQLKPAAEHWYLARNGGGGALQIDASRVARGERPLVEVTADKSRCVYSPGNYGGSRAAGTTTLGSWPTNALLSHAPCCRERGTREVKGASDPDRFKGRPKLKGTAFASDAYSLGMLSGSTANFAPNGLETVPAFDCLASCPCGLTTLATSGGRPPRCDCGEAMTWACPVAELDGQSGIGRSPGTYTRTAAVDPGLVGARKRAGDVAQNFADTGGASRFFPSFAYAAKAATAERHAGAEHLRWARDASTSLGWREVSAAEWDALPASARGVGNIHPTVKSLKLARWLVRLLCPPGGRGGDPFCGSGSIGIAAALEGFDWISSDLSPEAIRIAQARLAHWQPIPARLPAQAKLFEVA